MDELLRIMERLRDPTGGCPWDVEQTFATIAPYTIEEAYEVVDAIQRNDMAALKDELGDLLLQVVFHARMAEEAGHFNFQDVAKAVSDKMVRRHPHVFGDETVASAEAQTANWEAMKAAERAAQGDQVGRRQGANDDGASAAPVSALDGVARALPALTRAEKLQKRAARVGFDWLEATPVLDKVVEEVEELRTEIAAAGDQSTKQTRTEEELGDLLFAVANLARHLGHDPEGALRAGNDKFEFRFRRMEELYVAAGRSIADATLDDMEAQWQAVKRQLATDAENP